VLIIVVLGSVAGVLRVVVLHAYVVCAARLVCSAFVNIVVFPSYPLRHSPFCKPCPPGMGFLQYNTGNSVGNATKDRFLLARLPVLLPLPSPVKPR
jgi:hypothetical protein